MLLLAEKRQLRVEYALEVGQPFLVLEGGKVHRAPRGRLGFCEQRDLLLGPGKATAASSTSRAARKTASWYCS